MKFSEEMWGTGRPSVTRAPPCYCPDGSAGDDDAPASTRRTHP